MAASYPGAIKTFATRTAGQTIDAGHVNDLQDEVTAIETGLLNGTAPLTSSHATVVGLNVTGNSTLGSTITIGGLPYVFPSSGGSTGMLLVIVSTSGSTMSCEWRTMTQMFLTVPEGRFSHSAAQAIASDSAAYTGLNWNTNDRDVYGLHSTSVNSSRIIFAASTGMWHIGATLTFDKKASIERQVILRMNDSSRVAGVGAQSLLSINQTVTVATIVRAAAVTDYFTVMVCSADGGSSVVAHSTGNVTQCWAKLIV